MCLCRWELVKVGYHPVKFGGHRHSDNGDIVLPVCHVILQDHMIKVSCDFIGRSLSRYVAISPSLVTISTVVVKI